MWVFVTFQITEKRDISQSSRNSVTLRNYSTCAASSKVKISTRFTLSQHETCALSFCSFHQMLYHWLSEYRIKFCAGSSFLSVNYSTVNDVMKWTQNCLFVCLFFHVLKKQKKKNFGFLSAITELPLSPPISNFNHSSSNHSALRTP